MNRLTPVVPLVLASCVAQEPFYQGEPLKTVPTHPYGLDPDTREWQVWEGLSNGYRVTIEETDDTFPGQDWSTPERRMTLVATEEGVVPAFILAYDRRPRDETAELFYVTERPTLEPDNPPSRYVVGEYTSFQPGDLTTVRDRLFRGSPPHITKQLQAHLDAALNDVKIPEKQVK